MLTKAIVEQVIDNYSARVRIPIYNSMQGASSSTSAEELPIATICSDAGIKPVLEPGEVVYVDFENFLLDHPVILGVLSRANTTSAADVKARSLNVEVDCTLPEQTYELLYNKFGATIFELQNQIDALKAEIETMKSK